MDTVLAVVGAALSCLLSLPQAVRVLRTDDLAGISPATYVLAFGNALVWGAWALATGNHAAGVPALVNAPVAVLVLWRVGRTSRAASGPCPCP